MKLTTFWSSLKEVKETKQVETAQIWMVSWTARFGEFSKDTKRVAKAFLDEGDANLFKKALEDAQQLLHNTENLNIRVEKQTYD